MIDKVQPVEIDFDELQLEEVIGVGGFGKVYRYRISVHNNFRIITCVNSSSK